MVWAFIFQDENIDTAKVHTRLEYGENVLLVYGVQSVEEGAQLAKRLWDEAHCELVEFCGGFKEEGARRAIEVTKGEVRIGFVTKLKPEIASAIKF